MNVAPHHRRDTDPVEELLREFICETGNQNDDENQNQNQNMYVVKELDMNCTIQGSLDFDCSKGQKQHDQGKDNGAGIIDSTISPNRGEVKKSTADSMKEEDHNADCQQPTQTISSQYKHDIGETSFSAMLRPSTNPPGSIPFLRNDSTRSDASTISTQSFAFPILNSEWTMSPVKLNKNDQRHGMIGQHRSRWRSLFCCSF